MNNEQALMVVQPEEGGQLLELQFVDGPAPEPEEEISGDEHPNFIESNTQAITIEELATTFSSSRMGFHEDGTVKKRFSSSKMGVFEDGGIDSWDLSVRRPATSLPLRGANVRA